jgi:hypothetical protein
MNVLTPQVSKKVLIFFRRVYGFALVHLTAFGEHRVVALDVDQRIHNSAIYGIRVLWFVEGFTSDFRTSAVLLQSERR